MGSCQWRGTFLNLTIKYVKDFYNHLLELWKTSSEFGSVKSYIQQLA
jgi:hypothetical protein